jgi:hypothetical protein
LPPQLPLALSERVLRTRRVLAATVTSKGRLEPASPFFERILGYCLCLALPQADAPHARANHSDPSTDEHDTKRQLFALQIRVESGQRHKPIGQHSLQPLDVLRVHCRGRIIDISHHVAI